MPQIASLKDFTHSSFSTREYLSQPKLNSRFRDIQQRINDLNAVAAEQESHRASSTAPSPNVRGRLWADTGNSGRVSLKLDPDGSGADDEVATRLETRQFSFATGGTATHKQSGALDVNTTADGGQSYTVPADTLGTNGELIRNVAWYSPGADRNIGVSFGAQELGAHRPGGSVNDGIVESYTVRTAAGAQKTVSFARFNSDALGSTSLVHTDTLTQDETENNNLVTASGDVTTWTAQSAAEANGWIGITWSPELGLFAAVSIDGTNRVMTSPDGENWTAQSAAEANSWVGITWSPELGLFAAVSIDGTNRVMTSPDGENWTAQSAAEANNWRGITWSPELGLFAAVSTGGTNRVQTSGVVDVDGQIVEYVP